MIDFGTVVKDVYWIPWDDENDDYMPASTDSIVVDPNWAIDEDGNIYPRSDELWTDDAHTYFES